MELKLAFIGFGNVARAFARILDRHRLRLEKDFDITWRATAIATARHGSIVAANEIELLDAVECVESGRNLSSLRGAKAVADAMEVIEGCDSNILFETSPLDALNGEPAISYIKAALSRGLNVVTANKGPIAFAYRELKALAENYGAAFRFEGTVMDGAPIFNLSEYCLQGCKIKGFYGVLNSTTNLILTEMERGRSFDEALDEARKIGVAEANADYDIDGWDAAIKAVALANVLMGADARPGDVDRRGIREISADDLNSARSEGSRIRLVARGDVWDGEIRLSVRPEKLAFASALGSATGTTNVIVFKTEMMGELAIFETDPGVEQTAYALFSDMLRVRQSLKPARA